MTIGIMGCDRGVGTTRLALALCSYCCSKRRKKVAYLELHARNEISQLLSEAALYSALSSHKAASASDTFADTAAHPPCFRLHGADYYPRVTAPQIPALLNCGYDYLILDMGSLDEADHSEYLRCDRKLVIGSLAPWKIWRYEKFFLQFDNIRNLGEGVHYLIQMGTAEDISRFSRSHHIASVPVPFIRDPFHIEKELFCFLEELLSDPISV